MKKIVITLALVLVACESAQVDSQVIECLLYSGETEIFRKDEIHTCEDKDGDGWNYIYDCDDLNPEVNPGVEEVPDDDVDNDCDNWVDEIHQTGDDWKPPSTDTDDSCWIIDNGKLYEDEDCDGEIG